MSRKQKDFSVTYPILSLRAALSNKHGTEPSCLEQLCRGGWGAGLPRAWEPAAAFEWLQALAEKCRALSIKSSAW